MIRADDIPEKPLPDIAKKESVETELSEDEQALLYAIDADIEDAAQFRRQGQMFEVSIARSVPENVVAALIRVWEAGDWVVGAFEVMDSEGRPARDREGEPDEPVFRLVFARPHANKQMISSPFAESMEVRHEAQEFDLPDETVVDQIVAGGTGRLVPLLVRMPTRSRPQQALEVLRQYRDMAVGEVKIEVILDEDDLTCNNTQFIQRLAELDCTIVIGHHKTKIEACNAGRALDWGVLLLASDDMVPVARGYDQKILAAMEKHFPLLDGAINFNDGYNKDHVREGEPVTCTLPILGRRLWEAYGSRVYYPEYRSIYCDTDQTFLLTKMNRMVFVDDVIIEHRHFANAKARFDELYQRNSKYDDYDKALFDFRRGTEFGAPKLMLSILICSLSSRRKQLERLVEYLRWQVRWYPSQYPSLVEICVDADDDITVGAKRQRLLERALGTYVVFVDDDDWVDSKYVERVLGACGQGGDCCSLVGVITENGENPKRFEHSLAHSEWYTSDEGVYIRTPNHLNAVKREIALQVGFVSKNVGEDHDYSRRLLPLLKSEVSTGETPIYYYWSVPSKSVQSGGSR